MTWTRLLPPALACLMAASLGLACAPEPADSNSTGSDPSETENPTTETTVSPTTSSGSTIDPTTGGTEGTTSTTSETDSDTCNFVCTTGSDTMGDIECDVFAQDCPDEDQKCAAWDSDFNGAWDATKCVDVMGNGQHGDPCTQEGPGSGVDDCAEGVMCWNANEEGVGVCVELCTGSLENQMCAPNDTTCVVANGGVLNLCLSECDPLLQDCGNMNDTCIPAPEAPTFVCVLDASGGMGFEGTPCEFANACNQGFLCLDQAVAPYGGCDGAIGCCASYCDTQQGEGQGNPSCANAEQEFPAECVPWYEMGQEQPGLEHVGVCIQPM